MIKRSYFCDCHKLPGGKVIRRNMREVKVYEDLACVECGYYAKVKTERLSIEPDGLRLEVLTDEVGEV